MKKPHVKQSRTERAAAARTPASLGSMDLNLLVALDILLTERSVTRAARKMGVTQSAMSHILRRLREQFDEPLFLKTSDGMSPTPLALEMAPLLRRALRDLQDAISTRPRFDPATSQRQFAIASADYGQVVLLPKLAERIYRKAPRVTISAPMVTQDSAQALAAGQIDLILGAIPVDLPDIMARKLFDERFVCLLRADHPDAGRPLSLERFTELSHVLISPMGTGAAWVDPVLEKKGMRRHIALRVQHYMVAPLVVAQSDLLLTVAERVAKLMCGAFPLRMLKPPLDIPGFSVSAYWHGLQHDDPAHAWLRAELFAISAEV
jgi:DNA-binding transcriptional LysR family regulator